MRVIAFDIWSNFGHFKRIYTSASPLTLPFPPPPTVKGILGAIVGAGNYISYFKDVQVGIRIINPIRKTVMGFNFLHTKEKQFLSYKKINAKYKHIPVRVELLKKPYYRIYLSGNDEKLDELRDRLENKCNDFTVSLGWAEMLANYQFVDEFEGEPIHKAHIVHSIIPTSKVEKLNMEAIKDLRKHKILLQIQKERIHTAMKPDRTPLRYEEILYEKNGEPIPGEFTECIEIKNKGSFSEIIYLFS